MSSHLFKSSLADLFNWINVLQYEGVLMPTQLIYCRSKLI